MTKQETTISLKNEDGSYMISIPRGELDMEAMIHELIVPLLSAAGYHHKSIESYIEPW